MGTLFTVATPFVLGFAGQAIGGDDSGFVMLMYGLLLAPATGPIGARVAIPRRPESFTPSCSASVQPTPPAYAGPARMPEEFRIVAEELLRRNSW